MLAIQAHQGKSQETVIPSSSAVLMPGHSSAIQESPTLTEFPQGLEPCGGYLRNPHRTGDLVIAQAEGKAAMSEVRIGDIVLYHDPDVGGQVPAIIVNLDSQERAWLNVFTIHGSVALETPKPRGDQPGQWELRPRG